MRTFALLAPVTLTVVPDSRYTLPIVIRAGEQTHADFPQPVCV